MILYILIGLVSGVISGMGIGGGTILIPALIIFCGVNQHQAQNTNLLYFIPTAVIALIAHFKNGNIEKKALPGITLFGLIGAVGGALLAVHMDANVLRKLFGFFLLAMGLYEFFIAAKAADKDGRKKLKTT